MHNHSEETDHNELRMNNDRERDQSSSSNQHPYGTQPMGVYYFPPNYQNVQGYQQFQFNNDGIGSNMYNRPVSGEYVHQQSTASRPSAVLEQSMPGYDRQHVPSEAAPESSSSNIPSTPPTSKPARPKRKKPKDKPKRPLSAYNIFFREERANILAQTETPGGGRDADESAKLGDGKVGAQRPKKKRKKIPHGKVTFENLAKMIGSRWKEMPPSRLRYYQDLADRDTIRYEEEMTTWSQKMREAKAKMAKEMEEKRKLELSMPMCDEEESDKAKKQAGDDKKKSSKPDESDVNVGLHVGQRHDQPSSHMSNSSWNNAGQYGNYPPILMMPSMPVPNAMMPAFPGGAADAMATAPGQRQTGEMPNDVNNYPQSASQHQMPQVMMPQYMMGQNQGYMPM